MGPFSSNALKNPWLESHQNAKEVKCIVWNATTEPPFTVSSPGFKEACMRRFEVTVLMALSVVFVLAGCGAKQMALPVPPEDRPRVLVVYRDLHFNAGGLSAQLSVDGYSVGTLYKKVRTLWRSGLFRASTLSW